MLDSHFRGTIVTFVQHYTHDVFMNVPQSAALETFDSLKTSVICFKETQCTFNKQHMHRRAIRTILIISGCLFPSGGPVKVHENTVCTSKSRKNKLICVLANVHGEKNAKAVKKHLFTSITYTIIFRQNDRFFSSWSYRMRQFPLKPFAVMC